MTSANIVHKKDLIRIGKLVKHKRQQLGLSQDDFSEKAGLHRTYISQFELGLRNPTFTTLVKICDALGVELKELLNMKI